MCGVTNPSSSFSLSPASLFLSCWSSTLIASGKDRKGANPKSTEYFKPCSILHHCSRRRGPRAVPALASPAKFRRPLEAVITKSQLKSCSRSSLVLFVADLFHPVNGSAVELFLNGDVRHGRGCRGTVPMLFARRKPDHVARPDFFNRAAPTLHAPAASGHDQGLTQRMRVPRGSGAGFERDTGTDRARRSAGLKQGVDAHRAGEPVGRSIFGRL